MPNNNKTVVITGASSGFGESAVKAFADQGYRVWGTMRDTAGRNAAKMSALEAYSPAISVQDMDVTDDDSVAAGFARITRDRPVAFHLRIHLPQARFIAERAAGTSSGKLSG